MEVIISSESRKMGSNLIAFPERERRRK